MRKTFILFAIIAFGLSIANAQQHRFRHANSNLLEPSIAIDQNGDVVIATTTADDPSCTGSCTSTGSSDIVVTKRDLSGNDIWSKKFNFSDVDRAVHVAEDGDDYVVLGVVEEPIISTTRAYEFNPVVFVLDQNGNLTKGKIIQVPHATGNLPYDFIGTHITPDGAGGYIMTGFITDDNANCFHDKAVIRISTVMRLDANLNVSWEQAYGYPMVNPSGHLYVSANHALMDPGGQVVYITGQERVPTAPLSATSKPVAIVLAMDINTGAVIWHKSYDIVHNEISYYGVKLLLNERGEMAWFLRPAAYKQANGRGVFATAEVDPTNGGISNLQGHVIDEGIVADMEFFDDDLLVVSSISATDNQAIVGISWPANTSVWHHIYLAPDAWPNFSICDAPYYMIDLGSIALFYPQNLVVDRSTNSILTVVPGDPASGDNTIQLAKFNGAGGQPTHNHPNCFAMPMSFTYCESCELDEGDFDITPEDIDDEFSAGSTYPFVTVSVPGADVATITKDDCANGIFADVVLASDDISSTSPMGLVAYPNPVKGEQFLLKNESGTSVSYILYGADGRMIENGLLAPYVVKEMTTVDRSGGLYLVRWMSGGNEADLLKIMIE